jgi:predicted nucleic acid-binding protein
MSGNTKKRRERPQRRKKVYWDTCVFIAWIGDESSWPDDVKKGIQQTIELAISGEVMIVTSALTLAEILETKMTPDQKIKFRTAFSAPYLQLIDVDRKIGVLSAQIRERHDTRIYGPNRTLISGTFIRMPDSIHLATAIHLNVAVLNTLDGSGRSPKRLDMLELDGKVGGYSLSIKLPSFVPPPEFSKEPIEPVSGQQGALDLFSDQGFANESTTSSEETVTVPADVQPSGDGNPEDQTGTQTAEEKNEGEGSEIAEGQPEPITIQTAGEGTTTAPSPPTPSPSVNGEEQAALGSDEAKTSNTPPPSPTIVQPESKAPDGNEPPGDVKSDG